MEAATRAVQAKCYQPAPAGSRRASEAAELGGAAQGVGDLAGGAERVDQPQDREAAAVDAEDRRAGLVADRDGRVHGRVLAGDDAVSAVALYLVTRTEPAAEHGDDLIRRHVLTRHPYLGHGPQNSAICWKRAECAVRVSWTARRRYRAAGPFRRRPGRWPGGSRGG